jgi:hypothetical protein
MPRFILNHKHRPPECAWELRLPRVELHRIERELGTGSARTAAGKWSSAKARRLNRLRYRQAVCKARIIALEESRT